MSPYTQFIFRFSQLCQECHLPLFWSNQAPIQHHAFCVVMSLRSFWIKWSLSLNGLFHDTDLLENFLPSFVWLPLLPGADWKLNLKVGLDLSKKKNFFVYFLCKGYVFLILHCYGSHIKPACPKEQMFFIYSLWVGLSGSVNLLNLHVKLCGHTCVYF